MTIMLKNPNTENEVDTKVTEEKEHSIKLTRNIYEALSIRRLEISSLVSSHLVWDNENSTIVLLGSDDSVQHTACILSQYLSSVTVPRRLVGRSLHSLHTLSTITDSSQHSLDDAKNLLLMSQLPPELTISSHAGPRVSRVMGGSGLVGGHNSLGRTLSDSHSHVTKLRNKSEETVRAVSNLTRRKLESEDSSYDSDHEYLAGTLSAEHGLHTHVSHVSKSHDDVTRSYSETLGQEFAEYVSIKPDSLLPSQQENTLSSRESSPAQSARHRELIKESSENEFECFDKELYLQKVEKALKLGYAEELTRKALLKVGLTACNDDLLKELVRLQQSKVIDPNETLLKEPCGDSVQTTVTQSADTGTRFTCHDGSPLRPIVIDGSNVAMSHGNSEVFSCQGILICVEWFQKRGHKEITVFIPSWRKESSKPDSPMTNVAVLKKLEKDKILRYTPSRQFEGRRIAPHDDRFILNLAAQNGAIVVSNDHYRELINEKKEFKKVIEERLLMYTFVGDIFMPPDDPMGRNGPTLDNFLKVSPSAAVAGNQLKPCPYASKCTYGNKCKFFHAERGNVPMKTVSDKLKEQSNRQILEVRTRKTSRDNSPGDLATSKDRLRRTESDVTAVVKKSHPAHVSRTMSSRPLAYPGTEYYTLKSEVAKSNSADPVAKYHRDMRLSTTSVPIQADDGGWSNLEMGCLSSYGMQQPPPTQGPWSGLGQFGSMMHQPPPPPPTAQHRKLERQLTINPSYDPRINKSDISPNRGLQQPILSSEAIEYMHRNPPPPLFNIAEQSDSHHQNVTRNASAPDSIKHWGQERGQLGVTGAPHGHVATDPSVALNIRVDPPIQRLNSGSDTQLNRVMSPVNRALSADPFNGADTWKVNKFDTISPLLGTSIWSNTPGAGQVSQVSPPTSPPRNLGPVGSRPNVQTPEDDRTKQYQYLCNIFSKEQVDRVMDLLPNELDTKVLCKKIIELYP